MNLAKVLSDSQLEEIQTRAQEVLERVGVCVQHEEALMRCRKAGAKVDEVRGIVHLPKSLLGELLAKVPSSYTVKGATGREWQVGNGKGHSVAIVTDPWIIDYETQRPRRPRLADLRTHTILAQRLNHVGGIGRMDFPVTDVPEPISSLRALEEHLLHHDKHYLVYVASWESYLQWLQIGKILAQGQDLSNSRLFSVAVAIVSPLKITELNVNLLKSACDHGFTVIPTVCPMAGSTSPYTMASTLLQGHAENLFLAALTQIFRPGNPFLYAFGPSVTDMKTSHDLYYTLDKVLWKIGSVQLAKSRHLPVAAEFGGTMTWRYDPQNGAEGMLFMLTAVLSQADILTGIGSCYNAVGMSAEMMMIQDAWLEAARFLENGLPIDSGRLGIQSLKSVGPGGNFLTDDLTLRYLRGGEFFQSELFDYSGSETGTPLLARAHAKVESLTADFQSPLPGTCQEAIRRFFHDEYKRLGKR